MSRGAIKQLEVRQLGWPEAQRPISARIVRAEAELIDGTSQKRVDRLMNRHLSGRSAGEGPHGSRLR